MARLHQQRDRAGITQTGGDAGQAPRRHGACSKFLCSTARNAMSLPARRTPALRSSSMGSGDDADHQHQQGEQEAQSDAQARTTIVQPLRRPGHGACSGEGHGRDGLGRVLECRNADGGTAGGELTSRTGRSAGRWRPSAMIEPIAGGSAHRRRGGVGPPIGGAGVAPGGLLRGEVDAEHGATSAKPETSRMISQASIPCRRRKEMINGRGDRIDHAQEDRSSVRQAPKLRALLNGGAWCRSPSPDPRIGTGAIARASLQARRPWCARPGRWRAVRFPQSESCSPIRMGFLTRVLSLVEGCCPLPELIGGRSRPKCGVQWYRTSVRVVGHQEPRSATRWSLRLLAAGVRPLAELPEGP